MKRALEFFLILTIKMIDTYREQFRKCIEVQKMEEKSASNLSVRHKCGSHFDE